VGIHFSAPSPSVVTADSQPEPEEVVSFIEGHTGDGHSRKYMVVWASGDKTLESRANLVDNTEGDEVITEQLLKYWEQHPSCRESTAV
jgi:hypothetical protein